MRGEWVLKPTYGRIRNFNADGLAYFSEADSWNDGNGYMNARGEAVIKGERHLSESMTCGVVSSYYNGSTYLRSNGQRTPSTLSPGDIDECALNGALRVGAGVRKHFRARNLAEHKASSQPNPKTSIEVREPMRARGSGKPPIIIEFLLDTVLRESPIQKRTLRALSALVGLPQDYPSIFRCVLRSVHSPLRPNLNVTNLIGNSPRRSASRTVPSTRIAPPRLGWSRRKFLLDRTLTNWLAV